MGVFAASAAAGLSSATSAAGGLFSQKQQYGFNKQQRLKGPGWDVKGLRSAGLNPILAATKGHAPSTVGGFQVSPMDIAQSMERHSSSSAKGAEAELKKVAAYKTAAETKLAHQLSDESAARTDKEHFLASAAQADAYMKTQVRNVYASKYGKRFLPVMRAAAESGLRPDLALGVLPSSAAAVVRLIFSKKKMPIGF